MDNILVLGGTGRIGNEVNYILSEYSQGVISPGHRECDLLDVYKYEKWFYEYKPKLVINAFGKTTNIQMCKDYPATIFRDTIQANLNVLDMCRKYDVAKLVNIVCSCSYPSGREILVEDEFMSGEPHESVSSHAYAKRMVYVAAQLYQQQFKVNTITLALNNVFGGLPYIWANPSRLKFLDSIIKKIVDAKLQRLKKLTLWGSGKARREVIYYKDAAKYVVNSAELYNDNSLLNIGTGWDLSIAEWADVVSKVVNWKGKVEWNTEMNDGQMKKLFDVSKMRSLLGYEFTPIEDAIEETAQSYLKYLEIEKAKAMVQI